MLRYKLLQDHQSGNGARQARLIASRMKLGLPCSHFGNFVHQARNETIIEIRTLHDQLFIEFDPLIDAGASFAHLVAG